ncbi:MAG: TerC family protein [Verrucomicrobia bacterium]|nr:TerC family protein [Verrucomicrobiota bacterium]MBP8015077.1 TerC family protein [Verrucomicrobiota bacterium]NLH84290.1 TerC family protein [Verrucomicrobiota bacterium]
MNITAWHWAGFIGCVLVFLALDLGLFHRRAHVVKFREALLWTSTWFCLAMLFALALKPLRGKEEALEFLTGYLIELSLSMDNVFVIAMLFAYFQIPRQYQHRVLFWGIVGALVMRGLMIGAGVALVAWLHWVLYVLGAFVLFTGLKMLFVETRVHPEKNRVVKWVRKLYPVTPHLDGQKFFSTWQGRLALTPLALVLVMVETTDLIFALDSIPAIFAVTTRPFIIFTSNVFAVLGLRSLYFVLAGALEYFRYLKAGLALVLAFIGCKMLLDPHGGPPLWFQLKIPISVSLFVVGGIIVASIALSLTLGRRQPPRSAS